jgi:hypothetical protein
MFASVFSQTNHKYAYGPRRARLELEALEDRATPSTFGMESLSSLGDVGHTVGHSVDHHYVISPCIHYGPGEEIPQQ